MTCILVVEDDPLVRDVLVEFLAEQGHDALAASGAAEARGAMAARSVELVIADCVLHGEQGEAFAQYARANGVPAILMTGDGARLMAAREKGFLVLRKPFRLAQLAELILRLLDGAAKAQRNGTGCF
jgi:DNA-binding NtrC family response regulator